jgi:hypothetical protein
MHRIHGPLGRLDRAGFATVVLVLTPAATALCGDSSSAPGVRPLEGSQEESFPDGSTGRIVDVPRA